MKAKILFQNTTDEKMTIMDNQENTSNNLISSEERNKITDRYGQLKFIVGLIVMFFSVSISVFTTINAIYMFSRFQILQESKLIQLNEDGQNSYIAFNQDISAESLRVRKAIELSEILAQQLDITDNDVDEGSNLEDGARLHLDSETIYMQAKSYGSLGGQSNLRSFRLNNRVDELRAPSGIRNVKLIRGPRSSETDVDVQSDSSLEISGNLGLKVHSKRTEVEAAESIHLTSMEDSVVIEAREGLRLPSLQRRRTKEASLSHGSESSNSLQESADVHQICINPEDGRLFQATSGLC